MAISGCLLASYMGANMLNSHPKTLAYSLASILSVILLLPIWYGAYRWTHPAAPIPAPATQPFSPATVPTTQTQSTQPATAPTTIPDAKAINSDGPPSREAMERLTTVSQLIYAIDSYARWIDKALGSGDKPSSRADVHAFYVKETAIRLGVDVPGQIPAQGTLLSDEQKWLIALKNAAIKTASKSRPLRRVSIRASCVMPKEVMSTTWFMFTAAYGCVALYPIETALFLHITSRSAEPVTIVEYSVECRTRAGKWETLPSFSIPRSGKMVGALNIQKAVRFEIADPMLDSAISDAPLLPNETISGWSILGQVEQALMKKFRMRIRDEKGNEFVEDIGLPLDVRSQPSPETCMRFHIPETDIDLSQIPIKQYFTFR